MKTPRVYCDECENFILPIFKEENNLISPIIENAKCKLGKKVMFRQPIFNRPTNMVASNDYGWIRYCNEFKELINETNNKE